MALKLAFNPITAKFDLVQNLASYEKLAIPVTTANFFAAITNSTLVAGQWYLLTDYQNETTIANTATAEYNVGAVEEIYLFATSTNTFHPEGISKTYPDEKVYIKQTVPAITTNHDWYDYGSSYFIYMDGGYNSYPTTSLTAIDANSATLSVPAGTLAEIQADMAGDFTFYIYLDDYIGGSASLDSSNYGVDWEMSGTTISFINGGAYYGVISFTTCIESGMVDSWCENTYAQASDYYPALYTVPTSSTTLEVKGTDAALFEDAYGDYTITFSDYDSGETENFTPSNKGTLWDYNPATHIITYNGSLIDFETLRYNAECSCSFYELIKAFPYGNIVARRNERLNVYIQADYRSQLFRRYKILTLGAWSSTASEGETYTYNGGVYYCINTTADTPNSSNQNWLYLGADSEYMMPDVDIIVQPNAPIGYIYYDSSESFDLPMFDTAVFDALTEPINLNITAPLSVPYANVTIKGINYVTNSDIVANNSVINTIFAGNKVTMDYSVIAGGSDFTGNTISSMYKTFTTSAFRYNTIKTISGCLLDIFTYNVIDGSMQYVVQKTTFTSNQINTVLYCKFMGYSANNTILSLSYTNFNYYTTSSSSPSCSYNYFTNFGSAYFDRTRFNDFTGVCTYNKFYSFNVYGNTFYNISGCSFYYTISFNRILSINPAAGNPLWQNSDFLGFVQYNVGHIGVSSCTFNKEFSYNKFHTRVIQTAYATVSAGGTGYTANDLIHILHGHTTTAWAASTAYTAGQYVTTTAGINAWSTGNRYEELAFVTNGGNTYYCTTRHMSGTFATDLAAGLWLQTTPTYYCTTDHTSTATFTTDRSNAYWIQCMPATVKATTVSGGVVTAIELINGGSMYSTGVSNSSGGTGTGFKLNLSQYSNQVSPSISKFYGTFTSNEFYQGSLQTNFLYSDFSQNYFFSTKYGNTCSNNILFSLKQTYFKGCNFSQNTISSTCEGNQLERNTSVTYQNILSTMRYVELNAGYALTQNTIYALGGNLGAGLIMNASISTSFIGDILGGGITISSPITSKFYVKTNPVLLGGQSAKSISLERHQTANQNGNSLTFEAGGATVGATDKNGGPLLLYSGMSTGSGSSFISFYTSTAGAAGTTDRTQTLKMMLLGNGRLGVGTTGPDKQVEINAAAGDCLRLTYNDPNGSAANYVDLEVSSSGDLTITPSGGDATLVGTFKPSGYKSSDGTAAITQTIAIKDFDEVTHTMVFKDGLLTSYTSA